MVINIFANEPSMFVVFLSMWIIKTTRIYNKKKMDVSPFTQAPSK